MTRMRTSRGPRLRIEWVAVLALGGLTGGLALFAVFDGDFLADFLWLAPALTALLLVVVAVYLATMKEAGRAAGVSVALIGERHFVSFYGIGLALGMVLPVALGLYVALAPAAASPGIWAIIAVARVAGDVVMRDVILKVGVYDKVI